MKTVLINPPMDVDVALGKAGGIAKYTVMIPHGLASIAAVLLKQGIECSIIDGYAENLSVEAMVERTRAAGARLVGISCVTPVMPIVHAIAKRLKETDQSLIVVAGGPHPSILPDEVLADRNIDFIVRGEGEETLLALLRSLEKGGGSAAGVVDGLSMRNNGSIAHTGTREPIEDLDSLPLPAYQLLPMHLYTAPPQWSLASPSYQIVASRGCPYRCGFCYVGMGKRVRYKSPRLVCEEIEYLIENHGCRQIVFADTTFPFNNRHARGVCDELIRRKLNKKIVWFTSTRADIVSEEMLRLMYRAGCRLITLGVESGNQEILDFINKNITLEQVARAVTMAHKAGINITASYILGLPGETPQTIENTINFAKRLNTLYAQFNVIVPYPGTAVYDYAREHGLLRNRDWGNYVSLTSMTELDPPFITSGLSKEELLRLQRKAYNNYYLRPVIVGKHVKKMVANREFKKYLASLGVLLKTFAKK